MSRDKPIHFFQGLETCCKVFFFRECDSIVGLFSADLCHLFDSGYQLELFVAHGASVGDGFAKKEAVDMDENCPFAFRFQSPSKKQTAEIIKKKHTSNMESSIFFRY